jgi:hypothetical protein
MLRINYEGQIMSSYVSSALCLKETVYIDTTAH